MILGFKQRFVPKIQSGTKIHTLRDDPADRWQPGKQTHMATGVRTKNYNCFDDKHTCISTQKVRLIVGTTTSNIEYLVVFVDGKQLMDIQSIEFAENDGFDVWSDFEEWFMPIVKRAGGQKTLKLIHWTDFRY